MQLPHFAAAAHVVHQVKGIPFSANESHTTHPATCNLSVVYCTSTTAFNVCFIPSGQFASEALTRPPTSLFPSPLFMFSRRGIRFCTRRYANAFRFLHHFSCCVSFVFRIGAFLRFSPTLS